MVQRRGGYAQTEKISQGNREIVEQDYDSHSQPQLQRSGACGEGLHKTSLHRAQLRIQTPFSNATASDAFLGVSRSSSSAMQTVSGRILASEQPAIP
jgi:hypothetical protein